MPHFLFGEILLLKLNKPFYTFDRQHQNILIFCLITTKQVTKKKPQKNSCKTLLCSTGLTKKTLQAKIERVKKNQQLSAVSRQKSLSAKLPLEKSILLEH